MATVQDERIAILLQSLGSDLTAGVLSQIPADRASGMSEAISRLESSPPSEEEITDVLEDFNRFIEFALANSADLIKSPDANEPQQAVGEFLSTGDPFVDLEKLESVNTDQTSIAQQYTHHKFTEHGWLTN